MDLMRRPRRIKAFFAYFLQQFVDDRCLESAGVLVYTSLLSLVPLMAVGFTL